MSLREEYFQLLWLAIAYIDITWFNWTKNKDRKRNINFFKKIWKKINKVFSFQTNNWYNIISSTCTIYMTEMKIPLVAPCLRSLHDMKYILSEVNQEKAEHILHKGNSTFSSQMIVTLVTSSSVYLPLRHHGNDNNSRYCCRHFMLNQCFFAAITW